MNEKLLQAQQAFRERLEALDRNGAVDLALGLLRDGKATVPELYEQVLAPSLNSVEVTRANEDKGIWKEHVMTAIVRTIVESAHPWVFAQRQSMDPAKRALILCPEEEYHELGARMGADYFTMAGYDTVFIGCNTPQKSILHAAGELKPDILVISVTNYLNLAAMKKIVRDLRIRTGCGTMVAVAGSALGHAGMTAQDFGADRAVVSYADVLALREGLL